MSIYNRVAWGEGMFLAPQHFQQQDRFFENLIHHKTNYLCSYAWGMISLEIDRELLALGKFGLNSAHGILPDGTLFNLPFEDAPPAPIELPDSLSNKHIYLAIPLKKSGIPTMSLQQVTPQYRYHISNQSINDAMENGDEEVEVLVGKLQLQLLVEGQDLSDYSYVPIAFIKETRSDKKVILDPDFIPPCLDVQAAPMLARLVKEIQGLLHHRAQMLSQRLTDEQQSETAIAVDFMLLQLVNRYELIFTHLSHKQNLHPETLYLALIELLGEISTFTSETRRPLEPSNYDHDHLNSVFLPVAKSLRKALTMVLEQNATSIALEERKQGIWTAVIDDKTLLSTSNFILAVYADLPPDVIRMEFARQAKIAPVEQLKDLIAHQIPGIELQLMSTAPRQIPFHANYVYFSLNQQHESWQYLEKSAALAIHTSGNMPNLKLELWAIKG